MLQVYFFMSENSEQADDYRLSGKMIIKET